MASRRTRNLADFLLGGRSLGGAMAALGAGASDMSGWLLLGLPGAVYTLGLQEIWLPIGLSIGAYLNWQFVAKRLRVYSEIANNSLTIPAYFDNRFRDTSGILRVVTASAVLIFFTFYAAAGFVGGALLFQSALGINYTTALWIAGILLVGYTAIGGFLAVSWTDFFQGSLMFFALLLVPLVTLSDLNGHWDAAITNIQNINPQLTDVFANISFLTICSLLAWGLGYFGQPHILVRFMATKSAKEIPKARFICMTWMILSLYGAVFTGFIGIAYFSTTPLTDPESVFLILAQSLFSPWIAGILLAAVLSAIMSTIAAQLLASSSAVTEDFYHRFLRKKAGAKESILISRLTVIIVALMAIGLAYNPESSILNLVAYAWAGLGAAFGPVMLFSLFWRRMTRNAAVAGIILGGASVIIWKQLYAWGGLFTLYEIIPGFILASVAIIVVSLLDKKPAPEIEAEFTQVVDALDR